MPSEATGSDICRCKSTCTWSTVIQPNTQRREKKSHTRHTRCGPVPQITCKEGTNGGSGVNPLHSFMGRAGGTGRWRHLAYPSPWAKLRTLSPPTGMASSCHIKAKRKHHVCTHCVPPHQPQPFGCFKVRDSWSCSFELMRASQWDDGGVNQQGGAVFRLVPPVPRAWLCFVEA